VLLQSVIGDLAASDAVKLVGWSLTTYMTPDGLAWPSVAAIGRRANRGVRATQRALRQLQLLGLITVDHRSGRPSVYRATPVTQVTGVWNGTPASQATGGGVAQATGDPRIPGDTRRGFEGVKKGSRARATAPRFVSDEELIAAKNAEAADVIERLGRKVKSSGEGGDP